MVGWSAIVLHVAEESDPNPTSHPYPRQASMMADPPDEAAEAAETETGYYDDPFHATAAPLPPLPLPFDIEADAAAAAAAALPPTTLNSSEGGHNHNHNQAAAVLPRPIPSTIITATTPSAALLMPTAAEPSPPWGDLSSTTALALGLLDPSFAPAPTTVHDALLQSLLHPTAATEDGRWVGIM